MDKNIQKNEESNKKKKCALVAWFKGLKKPAKIGLIAGSAVVVASAITFPTLAACGVFNKTPVETVELKYDDTESAYIANVNLVKGTKYIVKVNSDISRYNSMDFFSIVENGSSEEALFNYTDNVSVEVEGKELKKTDNILSNDTEYDNFLYSGSAEYYALANFKNGGGHIVQEAFCPNALFDQEKAAGKTTINFTFTFTANNPGNNVMLLYYLN